MEVVKSETKELGLMQQGASLFLDVARFEHAQRVGKMLATSTMVPAQFQGERGIANCVIALNLAERMRVDPFMLMQNMYIVHGKPGIEAKLAIALMNGGGRFEPLEFEFDGEGETRKCRAFAKEIKSGKTLHGTWVTWQMAKAERWVDKDGSKWKTMPDLMFTYRAAMFFARVYDPGALLGLRTKDELEDMVIDVTPKRTLKVDTQTGEVKEDIYETKEPGPEKIIPPVEDWKCGICGFVSVSQRGLRKHYTQSHPEDDNPPFEPDYLPPEQTPAEAHAAAIHGKPSITRNVSEIVRQLAPNGNRLLGESIKKHGIDRWDKATDEQKAVVLKDLNAALDAKNEAENG